jgi:hypothetical protein
VGFQEVVRARDQALRRAPRELDRDELAARIAAELEPSALWSTQLRCRRARDRR